MRFWSVLVREMDWRLSVNPWCDLNPHRQWLTIHKYPLLQFHCIYLNKHQYLTALTWNYYICETSVNQIDMLSPLLLLSSISEEIQSSIVWRFESVFTRLMVQWECMLCLQTFEKPTLWLASMVQWRIFNILGTFLMQKKVYLNWKNALQILKCSLHQENNGSFKNCCLMNHIIHYNHYNYVRWKRLVILLKCSSQKKCSIL